MYLRTSDGFARRPLPYSLGETVTATVCAPAANGTLCALGSKNGGSTTAVFVPDAARGADPVCLLVWIHGDLICGEEGKNALSYVKSNTFPLAKLIAASQRPFVLVAPSMPRIGQNSHILGSPRTMNAFLEEVRTGLTGAGWSSDPSFGRLILAGHSRGYAVLNGLAARVSDAQSSQGALATLTDVWLFDTTYGKKHPKETSDPWLGWAKAKSNVNLRIFYRKNSDTAAVAELIRDKAGRAGLTNVQVQDFDRNKLTHCAMPRVLLPDLLAGAGDCPSPSGGNRTTTSPPSPAPSATPTPLPSNGALIQRIQNALASGQWSLALSLTVSSGNRDENKLTNMIFFARHPELKGQKLVRTEPGFKQLSREWLDIRDTIVRPFLAKPAPAQPPAAQPAKPAVGAAYPEVNTPLPPAGPGFIRGRENDSRSYGLPGTIRALQDIAAQWHTAHPQGPRIVIRDISPRGGRVGRFEPHSSHRVGLDVDLNLESGKATWYYKKGPKVNDRWTWVLNPTYSRSLTRELAQLILGHPSGGLKVKFILFDDPEVTSISKQVFKDKTSPHRDHLHVRFCAPPQFIPKIEKYRC